MTPPRPLDAAATRQVVAAARALRRGELVGLPTDTVYGLAADAMNPDAVRRLFEAKGRPPGRPLPLLLPGAGDLSAWSSPLPPGARDLAERFWPGPLTLVLPRAPQVLDVVTGGLETVGLRAPAHPLALAVLDAFGGALATPSANRHGSISSTTAAAVRQQLGSHAALVVDGGPCALGVESTVLALDGRSARILRSGALGTAPIEAVLGRPLDPVETSSDSPTTHFSLATEVELVAAVDASSRLAALRASGLNVALLTPGPGLYERLASADAADHDRLLIASPEDPDAAAALRQRLGFSRG